jgi:hypothetical protein
MDRGAVVSTYKYRQSVLTELLRHGIRPRGDTAPEIVRQYVNDLYLIEIRRLRDSMRSGQIPKDKYAAAVVELRSRYPILSLPASLWTEP